MKNKKHKNETDRLKELVKKSGVPLEIEISSLLNSVRAYETFEFLKISTSAYYIDKDEDKGRELDIKCSFPINYGEKKGIGLFLNLLIQCKKIPGNAWVFFKTPFQEYSNFPSTSVLDAVDWLPRSHVTFGFLRDLHKDKINITTSYDEYVLYRDKSNRRDDNLFEAIISVLKATSYEIESSIEGFKNEIERFSDILQYPPEYVELFYPIVVFDGKMYLAEKVGYEDEFSFTLINHIGLFIQYISGGYDITSHIDIVHRKEFKNFLKIIHEDIDIIKRALENDPGVEFRQEVMKALRWYLSRKK